MAKVLTKIINAICVLIIVAALVLLGSVILSRGQSYPSVMGFSIFRVMSASMEPEIKTDSMILVKKVDPKTLEVGDVITFISSDPTIDGYANTHRVMAIDNSSGSPLFTTKGDNNVIADKYKVPAGDVIGKVIFVSYLIGLFIRLMSNPLCFGAIIIIPLAIIFALNVRDLFRAAKAYEEAELRAELKAAKDTIKNTANDTTEDVIHVTDVSELIPEQSPAPEQSPIPDATVIQGLYISDIEAALNENVPDAVAIDFGSDEVSEIVFEPIAEPVAEEVEPEVVPEVVSEAPVFEGKTVEEILRERAGGVQDASVILFNE